MVRSPGAIPSPGTEALLVKTTMVVTIGMMIIMQLNDGNDDGIDHDY